ncbi:MAG: hypothetical protein ACP5J0_05820 [Pyrobaculum sp.]
MVEAVAVGVWVALMVYVYDKIYKFTQRSLLLSASAGLIAALIAYAVKSLAP